MEGDAAREGGTTPDESPWRGGWVNVSPRWEILAYVGLVSIAALLRLWDLGTRAVHHDESLHGYFSWQLYTGNGFEHNPLMHGPFLFHITAGSFFLFGDSDYTLRLPYALFGIALVLTPLLLRHRMGNLGALLAAAMLTISPSILYFSRFARNDIFMAVWTVGLVAVIWRYVDERKPRYLYIAAALAAFGFATKENQYLVMVVLGVPLLVMGWTDVWEWIKRRRSLSQWGAPASMLLLLATISLPLGGAAFSFIQDRLGVTLAARDGTPGVVTGAPDGAGYAIAAAISVGLLAAGAFIGIRWNARVWTRSFLIFAAVFVLFYTTVFTNWSGIATGVWQGLGYWIGQQEVARGAQPPYYYVMVTSVYEFLPLLVSLVAAVYYLARGDRFRLFLVWWAVASFVAYSISGEKMPWLETHVALPLVFLAATALGDLASNVPWRRAISGGGFLVFAGVPLFLIAFWRLILLISGETIMPELGEFFALWLLLAVMGLLLLGGWLLGRSIGRREVFALAGVTVVVLMALMTVRASWIASFVHKDVPQEMLVYTQTSPHVHQLSRDIHEIARLTGEGHQLDITIDNTSGFSWPWNWYLRGYEQVRSLELSEVDLGDTEDTAVAFVHSRNRGDAVLAYGNDFTEAREVPLRQWFPETYKDTTLDQFFGALVDPSEWRHVVDYFLYRETTESIGGENGYVFFNKDLPLQRIE